MLSRTPTTPAAPGLTTDYWFVHCHPALSSWSNAWSCCELRQFLSERIAGAAAVGKITFRTRYTILPHLRPPLRKDGFAVSAWMHERSIGWSPDRTPRPFQVLVADFPQTKAPLDCHECQPSDHVDFAIQMQRPNQLLAASALVRAPSTCRSDHRPNFCRRAAAGFIRFFTRVRRIQEAANDIYLVV